MRASKLKLMTEAIGERDPWLNIDSDILAVYFE
jgi:hypothetical protein